MYTDKVIEHFQNPRNVGEIEDADGVGEVGNPVCGDMMTFYIKVDDEERIQDVKFKTFGCGSAIASSSPATEWLKGRTLEEATKIKNRDIAEELNLPPVKIHCSVLAEDASKSASEDFRRKQKAKRALQTQTQDDPEPAQEAQETPNAPSEGKRSLPIVSSQPER